MGFLGYYTEKVARKGKVGIMIGNAEPAVVKPMSSQKVLSTTPISISIPTRDNPIILDMSLASIARGKIIEALRKGEEIPYGVAVDKEGKITTSPKEALEGGILPMGGQKGFYLMLTLELLVSFLTGSAIGPNVKGVLNTETPPNKGEIMIIIDPIDANYDAIDYMKNILRSDFPGEHGMKLREKAMREGIEIDEKLYETLVDMRYKVPYFT
ncbi:Ldh family oxidoreductase [Saccharolobus sp. A20]|uniref:Ldh family oxidoreductase n=1 Tax=Saccharolobus sp. A20 TaxID=1891280 RepID=UPI002029D7C8|nr:Ldh family oxidoreductase [Sulfolobus sp. A20]